MNFIKIFSVLVLFLICSVSHADNYDLARKLQQDSKEVAAYQKGRMNGNNIDYKAAQDTMNPIIGGAAILVLLGIGVVILIKIKTLSPKTRRIVLISIVAAPVIAAGFIYFGDVQDERKYAAERIRLKKLDEDRVNDITALGKSADAIRPLFAGKDSRVVPGSHNLEAMAKQFNVSLDEYLLREQWYRLYCPYQKTCGLLDEKHPIAHELVGVVLYYCNPNFNETKKRAAKLDEYVLSGMNVHHSDYYSEKITASLVKVKLFENTATTHFAIRPLNLVDVYSNTIGGINVYWFKNEKNDYCGNKSFPW